MVTAVVLKFDLHMNGEHSTYITIHERPRLLCAFSDPLQTVSFHLAKLFRLKVNITHTGFQETVTSYSGSGFRDFL